MVLDKNDSKTIPRLSRILAKGGVGVLPCDTIYGLSAMKGVGLAALRAVKNRGQAKPFLLVCTMGQAQKLALGGIPKDIRALWPGPLTAILPCAEGGTVALRVPDDLFLQSLLDSVGAPLYSTSVNEPGQRPLLSFPEIKARYLGLVDFLVEGGEAQGKTPSTLVDATRRPYVLVRQGAMDVTALIESSRR